VSVSIYIGNFIDRWWLVRCCPMHRKSNRLHVLHIRGCCIGYWLARKHDIYNRGSRQKKEYSPVKMTSKSYVPLLLVMKTSPCSGPKCPVPARKMHTHLEPAENIIFPPLVNSAANDNGRTSLNSYFFWVIYENQKAHLSSQSVSSFLTTSLCWRIRSSYSLNSFSLINP